MSCLRLLRTSAGRYLVPVGTALAAGRLLLASWSQGSWADTTLKATSMAVLLLPFVMLAGAQDGHRLLRTLRIRPRHRVPGHPARLWCTSSRPSRCGVWADTCWSW